MRCVLLFWRGNLGVRCGFASTAKKSTGLIAVATPSRIEMNLHADSEGRICGIETDALIDGGAFASFGHVTTYYNGVLHTAPYEIGAFHYTGARVWTNKPASGAMRGHGAVNSRCAVETGVG